MRQNRPDDERVLDAGDHPHRPTAAFAARQVQLEHPLEALRPVGARWRSAAVGASEAELNAAAAYFSVLRFKPWIRVVETATVPKTHVAGYMLVPLATGGVEAIGQRIVETPENVARTELRDSRSGFVAYVLAGSLARGETLVTTGGAGRTIRCRICHGADLKGFATVLAIAGRSPSDIVRQLYDMQAGTRHGVGSELMKEPVAKLTIGDIVAIAAYVAARALIAHQRNPQPR